MAKPRFASTYRHRHQHRRRLTDNLTKLVRALEFGEYELVAKTHSVQPDSSTPAVAASSSELSSRSRGSSYVPKYAICPSTVSSTSYDEMTSSSDLFGSGPIPTIVYRYHVDPDEVMSPKYDHTVYCHSPRQSARSSTGRTTSSTASGSIVNIFDEDFVCNPDSVKIEEHPVPKSITGSTFSEPLSPMRWSDYTAHSDSSFSWNDLHSPAVPKATTTASGSSSWQSMPVEKKVRFSVASPAVHTSCVSIPLDVEYQPIRYTSSTSMLMTSPTERLDRMRYLEQMCTTLTTELEQNKRELEEHRKVLGEHRQQLDSHSLDINEEARLRNALWAAVENQAELVEAHERRTVNLDELNASLNGLELRMELVEKQIIGGGGCDDEEANKKNNTHSDV